MSVITFPTLTRSAFDPFAFQLVSNTQVFQSPLNKQVQTLELPGARWVMAATFNSVNRAEWRSFQAFLTALRGSANRFMIGDLSHTSPLVGYTGNMSVSGANQSGANLVTTGWTGTMSPGDYVQITTTTSPAISELRMVVAAATNNGSTKTLLMDSPLRNFPVNSSVILTTNAVCKMILIDDNQAKWGYGSGFFSPGSIQAVEVFE